MHIDSYSFGKIVIDGQAYSKDLLILPDRIIPNWWRDKGHVFAIGDLQEVLKNHEIEQIIFGLGAFSMVKIDPELINDFKVRGIEHKASSTGEAVKYYNDAANKKKTAAAFHITC